MNFMWKVFKYLTSTFIHISRNDFEISNSIMQKMKQKQSLYYIQLLFLEQLPQQIFIKFEANDKTTLQLFKKRQLTENLVSFVLYQLLFLDNAIYEQLFANQSVKQSCRQSQDVCYQSIRNYQIVSDRKTRRQQQFQARRKLKKFDQIDHSNSYPNSLSHQTQHKIFVSRFEKEIKVFQNQEFTQDILPQLADCLKSQNIADNLFGTMGVRKILQLQHSPLNLIVNLQIHHFLYNLLESQSFEDLQYQVVRCLHLLIFQSPYLTQLYIDYGIIDKFMAILSSNNLEILELVLLTFSNIFVEGCKKVKQYVLQRKFTQKIYENILLRLGHSQQFGSREKKIIQLGYSTIASIYRLNSEKQEELVRLELMVNGIQCLKNIIEADFIENSDCFIDCINAIFVHCERISSKQERQDIITQMLLTVIVSKLDTENQKSIKLILKHIGNFIAAIDEGTKALMSINILEKMYKFIHNQSKVIRREACWILANLSAEESIAISNYQNGKMMDKLTTMFIQDEVCIKKEILYILVNVSTQNENFMVEQYIRDNGIVEVISQMLKQDSNGFVVCVLKNLYIILLSARKHQKQYIVVNQFLKNNYYLVLENLQMNQSRQVYKYVSKILDAFFICDENVISIDKP